MQIDILKYNEEEPEKKEKEEKMDIDNEEK